MTDQKKPVSEAAIQAMIEALNEAEWYFDDYADVVDGDYGVPEPNREMRLQQIVQNALRMAKAE